MKSDRRDQFGQHANKYKSKGMESVLSSKGEEMKKIINAQAYIECSARTQYNLQEVFQQTIKVILHLPLTNPMKEEEVQGHCCQVA
jgi:GTPase SAR1 family protein